MIAILFNCYYFQVRVPQHCQLASRARPRGLAAKRRRSLECRKCFGIWQNRSSLLGLVACILGLWRTSGSCLALRCFRWMTVFAGFLGKRNFLGGLVANRTGSGGFKRIHWALISFWNFRLETRQRIGRSLTWHWWFLPYNISDS